MTPSLRALIVDDERLARKRLRSLLAVHPDVQIVSEAANLEEAAQALKNDAVDLVFLDVQLSPESGFDLIPQLGEPAPQVIFVTAHEEFAVRAFTVHATDYLLKPVHPDRLAATLEHVQRIHSSRPSSPSLVLRDRNRIRRVGPDRIAAIAAEGHYSRVYLMGEPAMFVSHSLKTLTAELPDNALLRLDRSLLVNLSCLAGFDVQSRDQATLQLHGVPETIGLGRTAITRLRAALANPPPERI
jgi:two-component system LytT family response regulator